MVVGRPLGSFCCGLTPNGWRHSTFFRSPATLGLAESLAGARFLAVAAIIAAAMAGFTTQITNFMTGAGTKLQSYIPV